MKSPHISHIASNDLPPPAIRGGEAPLWARKVRPTLAQRHDIQIVAPWDPRQAGHENNAHRAYGRIHFGRTGTRRFRKIPGLDPYKNPQRISRAARQSQPERTTIHGGGTQWPPAREKVRPHRATMANRHNDPALKLHQWRYRDWNGGAISVDTLGIPVERYAMMPHGVDMADCTPWRGTATRRQGIRGRFGIPADARVRLFCERMAPKKGAPHWAAAAATLIASRPDLWGGFAGGDQNRPNPAKLKRGDTDRDIQDSLWPFWNRAAYTGILPPTERPSISLLDDLFGVPATAPERFGIVHTETIIPDFSALIDEPKEPPAAPVRYPDSPGLRPAHGQAPQQAAEQYFG